MTEELPFIYGIVMSYDHELNTVHGIAIAEDGTYLSNHTSSDEQFLMHDLGMHESGNKRNREIYEKHYPNGYQTKFCPLSFNEKDQKVHEAFELFLAKEGYK